MNCVRTNCFIKQNTTILQNIEKKKQTFSSVSHQEAAWSLTLTLQSLGCRNETYRPKRRNVHSNVQNIYISKLSWFGHPILMLLQVVLRLCSGVFPFR